jgi:hypothetical protein
MNCIASKLSFAFCAALLCAAAASAQIPAYTEAGPIPPALTTAKTVFVSNGGSDIRFFPISLSGDANRAYSQFYAALKATGKYDLVGDPSQADLVLYLRLDAAHCPWGETECIGTSEVLAEFRLTIYDRKTHYVLWTATEPIESALLQKNHDRNFDLALSAVIRDFEEVTGKAPANP